MLSAAPRIECISIETLPHHHPAISAGESHAHMLPLCSSLSTRSPACLPASPSLLPHFHKETPPPLTQPSQLLEAGMLR